MLCRGDGGGRGDLDRAELLGSPDDIPWTVGIQQLRPHGDAPSLVAGELVRHGSRVSRGSRITSCWVARVIATYLSTAPSMPSPTASGSASTTRSNSSPFDSSGVSDRTRD